eukprot:10332409-Alexandrium_andersonii.AAC.1
MVWCPPNPARGPLGHNDAACTASHGVLVQSQTLQNDPGLALGAVTRATPIVRRLTLNRV